MGTNNGSPRAMATALTTLFIFLLSVDVAVSQVATVTWGDPSSNAPFIASITAPTTPPTTFSFDPSDIVQFVFYDSQVLTYPNPSSTTGLIPNVPYTTGLIACPSDAYPASNYVATLIDAPGAGTDTINYVSSFFGLNATITFTPTASGVDIGISTLPLASTRFALAEIRTPRLYIRSHATLPTDNYGFHGYYSGAVMPEPSHPRWNKPKSQLDVGLPSEELLIGAGAGMAVVSYWDATDGSQLMIRFDDELALEKRLRIENPDPATNKTTHWAIVHTPKQGRTPGNQYDHSYKTKIELLRGAGTDLTQGAYDTVARYREWAAASSRPWRSRPPWSQAQPTPLGANLTSVSPTIQNASVFVYQQNQVVDTRVEDLRTLSALLSTTADPTPKIVATWFNWYDRMFDSLQPDLPPFAATESELSEAGDVSGLAVALYDWVPGWDMDLVNNSTHFDPNSYKPVGTQAFPPCSAYGDLAPRSVMDYFVKDQCGIPLLNPTLNPSDPLGLDRWNWVFFDFRDAVSPHIVKNVLKRHYAEFDGSRPNGWYLDYFGGGGVLQDFRQAQSPTCFGCLGGNDGAWSAGKRQASELAKDSIRECDENGFLSTELPEEYLIPAFEAMHVYEPIAGESLMAGLGSWYFACCHGDMVRTMDIGLPAIEKVHVDHAGTLFGLLDGAALFSASAVGFHSTGVLTYRNGSGSELKSFIAAAAAPVNFATISGPEAVFRCMALHHEKYGAYRTFVEGRRMRALPCSWERDYLLTNTPPVEILTWITVNPSRMWSSVWRAHDGSIGILATNTSSTLPSGGSPLNIEFDPALYEMPAGAPLILERWDASTEAWTPAVTTTLSSSCNGSACTGSSGPTFTGKLCATVIVPTYEFEVFRVRLVPGP